MSLLVTLPYSEQQKRPLRAGDTNRQSLLLRSKRRVVLQCSCLHVLSTVGDPVLVLTCM